MRSSFVYVVPKLCQLHSEIQMKIFPVSINTQSRYYMYTVGRKQVELCRLLFTCHLRCSKRTQRGSRSCSRRTWVSHMSWVRFSDREALSQISYSISKGSVHLSTLMWQNCAQNTDWAVYTWFKTSFPEQIKKNNLRAAPLLFPSSQKKLGTKFSPVTAPKTAWLMRFQRLQTLR